ncbi:MAG: DUF4093 domain-containing protein [Clostridiales bacterium]|nr:DUF4093 domain-containing protein [Clostridiales bacterium]
MIKTDRAVLVEGKYYKIKLSSILDAVIIETEGFGIFSDKEKQQLIRRLAETRGLLILTDSDAAGFKIRSFIGSMIPSDRIKHAYIPDIQGKERRKTAPSKEGKLGVEGVPQNIIAGALVKAGVLCEETSEPKKEVTKTDFYEDGFSGRADSSEMRRRLSRKIGLPARLSSNALLQMVNTFMTYDDYKAAAKSLRGESLRNL